MENMNHSDKSCFICDDCVWHWKQQLCIFEVFLCFRVKHSRCSTFLPTHPHIRLWQVWNVFLSTRLFREQICMTWGDNSDKKLKTSSVCPARRLAKSSFFLQAGRLAEKRGLFFSRGAWRWQPGPLPGTLLSNGLFARAQKKSQFLFETVKMGRHDDCAQMEDIKIGCVSGCRSKGGFIECWFNRSLNSFFIIARLPEI